MQSLLTYTIRSAILQYMTAVVAVTPVLQLDPCGGQTISILYYMCRQPEYSLGALAMMWS